MFVSPITANCLLSNVEHKTALALKHIIGARPCNGAQCNCNFLIGRKISERKGEILSLELTNALVV